MGTTPTDSHHHLQQSRSTYPIDDPCTLISELLTDAPVRLPQDLIIEILLLLPVKSLLKFKCVSKSWLSLISSPQFVRSHFSTSSEADQYLNSQILFTTLVPISGIKQFSLYSALYEPSTNVSDIEYPSQKPDQRPLIAGIINGLVCLLIGADDVFLWNPVLRKSKLLPKPPKVTLIGYPFVSYGFGYDESNDDYKVVIVRTTFASGYETEVMVYSLRTDSWRRIEDFEEGRLHFDWFGKYADGKMYWVAGSSPREWKIVSLDMLSEKYGELQQPDYEAGVSRTVFGVSGGRLFMLCDNDLKKMDLWVMDKYGVEESWSKAVSIPYDVVHNANCLPQVVCILRNGEIVTSDGSGLLVYHSKGKEFRNIELGRCKHLSSHVYVESLVSPHGSGL